MSVGYYYELCKKYHGRTVEIRTHDGMVHRGVIKHVDHHKVYLTPCGHGGGFGYGYRRFGYGGFGTGLALGTIVGLTLLPFFFWW